MYGWWSIRIDAACDKLNAERTINVWTQRMMRALQLQLSSYIYIFLIRARVRRITLDNICTLESRIFSRSPLAKTRDCCSSQPHKRLFAFPLFLYALFTPPTSLLLCYHTCTRHVPHFRYHLRDHLRTVHHPDECDETSTTYAAVARSRSFRRFSHCKLAPTAACETNALILSGSLWRKYQ